MRIAFIFADWNHKKFEENVDVVSKGFGSFPPLGIGYASAIARRAGHETLLVDAHAEHLTPEQVLERITPFEPQMLGFLLTTFMFHDTMRFIKYLKKETGLPVIVGNVNMWLYPNETMSYKEIDYGIIGPAVDVLPPLLEAVEAGKPTPELPGICYRDKGEVIIRRPKSMREDFNNLPFPDRDNLPHHLYFAAMSKRKNLTAMITAKGCPADCSFCHIHNIPFSVRQAMAVCDEIQECIEKHDIHEIEIFDPSFTATRKRVMDICREMIRRELDVNWSVRARVDQVDSELLELMARAGCVRILYGMESGAQAMLVDIKKDTRIDQCYSAVKATKAQGIETVGFFQIGFPGETVDTLDMTVEFAMDLGVDYAQFFQTIPKPLTDVNDAVTKANGYDYWREYLLGNQEERRVFLPDVNVDQKSIEQAIHRAYRKFYTRPSYLISKFARVKSFEEFSRYVRSGVGLLALPFRSKSAVKSA